MKRSRVLLLALSLIASLVAAWPSAAAEQAQQPVAAARNLDKFDRALLRHAPVLKFHKEDPDVPLDADEQFFPVRVQAITNNVGNQLQRASGAPLATRASGGRGLTIGYLRGINNVTYPNSYVILESDQLNERGNNPDEEIEDDARRFQADPRYRDRIYGRVVRAPNDGGAWLQYWFFYYYNDYPDIPLYNEAFDHEGDFEMIQIKVNADVEPILAVYAQHKRLAWCRWSDMTPWGWKPVVYVAQGSHASYFHPGLDFRDAFNNGQSERRFKLIRIGNNSPRWLNWPGQWGGSGSSPKGPKQQGVRWTNPDQLFEDAVHEEQCRP